MRAREARPTRAALTLRARSAPIGEGGKPVIRPYTPVSHPDEKGHFDLVVKAYPTGVMSKHFASLKVGDTLECKGTCIRTRSQLTSGCFRRARRGPPLAALTRGDAGPMVKLAYSPNMKASIGMVAGGTGITPMLQVIEEVLRNPADKTTLSLVFGNVTEADILLKSRIDALAAKHPQQFKARCARYACKHAQR